MHCNSIGARRQSPINVVGGEEGRAGVLSKVADRVAEEQATAAAESNQRGRQRGRDNNISKFTDGINKKPVPVLETTKHLCPSPFLSLLGLLQPLPSLCVDICIARLPAYSLSTNILGPTLLSYPQEKSIFTRGHTLYTPYVRQKTHNSSSL